MLITKARTECSAEMFKRLNTPSFKPMPLRPPRKVVVNKTPGSKNIIVKPPGSIAKSPSSSDQLKQAAEQARESLETALASMNAVLVCALENREEVPPQYMQEFQRCITCLGDDIRVKWNGAIFTYMQAATLKMESRSPSPLLDLLCTSDTDSLSPPRTPTYLTARLPYRESGSVEF